MSVGRWPAKGNTVMLYVDATEYYSALQRGKSYHM